MATHLSQYSGSRLERAEREEVAFHRSQMCTRLQRDVSEGEARADWEATSGPAWRAEYQARMLSLQREEMLRYKWIESEKAQRDLGRDAILDWINKYAAQWRAWYETQSDGAR